MRRPHWRSAMFTAVSGAMSLSLLAGCATRLPGFSSSDETARYLRDARGRYVIPGPPSDPWGPYIREASNKFDIPEKWIRALMRQESGGSLYRNGRLITSSAGAMGLMQVMPGTYMELRARYSYLGPDPFDPHDNILAGVAYMREMYDMYGAPGFLAAYNAGPNRLDDYLANQRPLPDETRHYVAVIGPALGGAQPRVHSPAEQYALNQLPINIPPGPRFGYGATLPTMQVASSAPVYTPPSYAPPVFTAAAQPTYTYTPPQPRVVAWAQPPAMAPAPAQVPPPRVVAWAEPPRPAYAPAPVQAYAPPPQRTAVARDDDDDDTPARRHPSHAVTHVALAIPPVPPAQHGGGFHFISSAMAAEVIPVRRGHKAEPVSYERPAHGHGNEPAWRLHATGPVQAPPGCHKLSHGKPACGPERL